MKTGVEIAVARRFGHESTWDVEDRRWSFHCLSTWTFAIENYIEHLYLIRCLQCMRKIDYNDICSRLAAPAYHISTSCCVSRLLD